MTAGALPWPLAVLIALVGLYRVAPPQQRSLYLAPVSCTTAFILTLAALAVAVLH